MTQRLIFQHKYKSFGCANDVNLSFSDRLLMCKNTILIYYQHISYDMTIFLFMAWLKRSTFGPFVAYRIILGVGLLGLYYGYIG